MLILHIAVPAPLYHHFDYLAPDDIDPAALKPGIRLRVPWRKSEAIGVLLSVSRTSEIETKKLKKIIEILDEMPVFPEKLLALIQFSSSHYHYPIGEVFDAAMPSLLRQGRVSTPHHGEGLLNILPDVPPVLSTAQEKAVQRILDKSDKFQAFLLFGVTGSGKTEVYLQVIENILKQKKQALILVPEIGLTPQTLLRFQQRFRASIVALHSGLTDRERYHAWLQALQGEADIIIGTRSAIFIPLKNPGVIIVDEEHDLSFKQQEGFRYSARDLSVMRAKFENIPVILGSATPSLESLHNAASGHYELLTLNERAGKASYPVFHLIDLKKQPVEHGLSTLLIEYIQKHLSQSGQVLVFLNRRGFSPVLICHQCGWIADCKRCDARMTLHQQPLHLQCHHCAASRAVDKICVDCGAQQLFPLGAGTERIEEVLQTYFPKIPVVRIDRDTTRKKGALADKLAKIQTGEPCLLVGTQMLAKGHHFPAVTLSVILNVDSGLFSTDFRGEERTAQLILQVAGRAGRVEKPGEVILQTWHPEHPLLRTLLEKGYTAFSDLALQERQKAGFPPYQFFALVRAEAVQLDTSTVFLTEIKKLLSMQFKDNNVTLLGPIPAPMQKKAGKHRSQLLLQSSQRKHLRSYLDYLTYHLAQLKHKSHVRWSIDIDPAEMF
jgi:primosomal protein N' (replication factor Y)